jgi:long-subunit acyl-CoA synthetase (AMP-forming)
LVAPAWLAVSAFAGLAFLHAVVSVAVMARVSRSLPLLAARRKVVLAYLPLVLLAPTVFVGGVVVVAMLAGAALSTQPTVRRVWSDPRLMLSGRILLAVAGLASLPAFTTSIADIL